MDDQPAAIVLVVEDEPNIRELLSASLALSGFTVRVAGSGARALAAVAHAVPDIVVVDVMLPDCDGFTLARLLRDAHGSLPVVFLTACDGVEDRIAGFVAGGADYLTKPFSLEEAGAPQAAHRAVGGVSAVGLVLLVLVVGIVLIYC